MSVKVKTSNEIKPVLFDRNQRIKNRFLYFWRWLNNRLCEQREFSNRWKVWYLCQECGGYDYTIAYFVIAVSRWDGVQIGAQNGFHILTCEFCSSTHLI